MQIELQKRFSTNKQALSVPALGELDPVGVRRPGLVRSCAAAVLSDRLGLAVAGGEERVFRIDVGVVPPLGLVVANVRGAHMSWLYTSECETFGGEPELLAAVHSSICTCSSRSIHVMVMYNYPRSAKKEN